MGRGAFVVSTNETVVNASDVVDTSTIFSVVVLVVVVLVAIGVVVLIVVDFVVVVIGCVVIGLDVVTLLIGFAVVFNVFDVTGRLVGFVDVLLNFVVSVNKIGLLVVVLLLLLLFVIVTGFLVELLIEFCADIVVILSVEFLNGF